MDLVGALLCVGVFALCLHVTRIVPNSVTTIAHARAAAGVMRDPDRDDETKEREIQRYSLKMFALLGRLTVGAVLSLGVPLLLIWMLGRFGVMDFASVLSLLAHPLFIVATLAVMIPAWRLLAK